MIPCKSRIELVNQPLTEDLIANYVKYADILEAPADAHEAVMQTSVAAVRIRTY